MKLCFPYFSNLSFDRVTFCKELISPIGSSVFFTFLPRIRLAISHLHASIQLTASLCGASPQTSPSARISLLSVSAPCLCPLFLLFISFLSLPSLPSPSFSILLIKNAKRYRRLVGKSSITLFGLWDVFLLCACIHVR